MKFVTNVTNFRAGLMSKKLFGRTDIREYPDGLSIAENAIVATQGGAYKRFGLQTIGQLPPNQTEVQIETISAGLNKSAFLVFSQFDSTTCNWRIYDARGNATSGYGSITGTVGDFVVVPYEEYYVIVSSSGTKPPTYLRISLSSKGKVIANTFTISEDSYYAVPQTDVNTDPTRRIRVTGVNGAQGATGLESSGWNMNEEFYVGDWVMITGITYVRSSPMLATGIYRILGLAVNGLTAIVRAGYYYSSTIGTTVDALANFTPVTDGNGTVINYLPNGTVSEFFDEWSSSAWNDVRGFPRHAAVDEGRLVLASNFAKPVTIWGSQTNNPFFFLNRRFKEEDATFSIGSTVMTFEHQVPYDGDILETDPYAFSLATRRATEITFMESSVNFVVGTNRQEFVISGNNGALSQKNFTARPHTSHGSYRKLSVVFDNTVLFASRSRKKVFMFKYSQENGSYVSKEVTILNPDLFEGEIIRAMDWHEELDAAFIVTASGRLYTLTLNNETGTAAFGEHTIDGQVLDCTYIVAEDGEDYMALAVRRNNKTFIDKITSAEIVSLGTALNQIRDRFSYLDNMRVQANADTVPLTAEYSITIFDGVLDYIPYNKSLVKLGDIVTFTDPDGAMASLSISANTAYYVIPFEQAGHTGFRLADSLANAQANNFLQLNAGNTLDFFYNNLIFASFTKDCQVIPTSHIPNGSVVKVFAKVAFGEVEEFEFTADGSDTYDLGKPYNEVVYGQTYDFHIATMPIEAGQQWGTAQLGIKRVDKAGVRIYNTRSFRISTDGYNSEEKSFNEPTTGQVQMEVIGSPEYDHVVHIQNNKAEGCYISSLTLRGLSNDG